MVTGMERQDLTQGLVKELLSYNPETGLFIWKQRSLKWFKDERSCNKWNTRYAGSIAGTIKDGYFNLSIFNRSYKAHRVAWLYYYGYIPNQIIDHVDGNRLNNKITNLRLSNKILNAQNRKRAQINSKSGVLGVVWREDTKKWSARIKIGDKYKSLGSFNDITSAESAYLKAKRKYHEACTI